MTVNPRVSRFQQRSIPILLCVISWWLAIATVLPGCTLSRTERLALGQKEDAFRAMISTPVEPDIHLLTEARRYHYEDWIGLWVENKTNYTIRFKDQSLGLQAYQYEDKEKSWHIVLTPGEIIDPDPVIVTPGPRSALPVSSIPVKWIKASGTIRLVITGVTDQGQPFAAYKDIEIVD